MLALIAVKKGTKCSRACKSILTKVFNELSAIGDNIDNEDGIIYLLVNLPDSYKMLVTALEANTCRCAKYGDSHRVTSYYAKNKNCKTKIRALYTSSKW